MAAAVMASVATSSVVGIGCNHRAACMQGRPFFLQGVVNLHQNLHIKFCAITICLLCFNRKLVAAADGNLRPNN